MRKQEKVFHEIYQHYLHRLVGFDADQNPVLIQYMEPLAVVIYHRATCRLDTIYVLTEEDQALLFPDNRPILIMISVLDQRIVQIKEMNMDGSWRVTASYQMPSEIELLVDACLAADDPTYICVVVQTQANRNEIFSLQIYGKAWKRIRGGYENIVYYHRNRQILLSLRDRTPDSSELVVSLPFHAKEVVIKDRYLCSNRDYFCLEHELEQGSELKILNTLDQKMISTICTNNAVVDAAWMKDEQLLVILNQNGNHFIQYIELDGTKSEPIDMQGSVRISNRFNHHVLLEKESLLNGTEWLLISQEQKITKLPGFIKDTCIGDRHIVSSLHLLVYTPHEQIKGCMVSLHGGPESCEYDELRYLGLYRVMLKAGWMVVVLNYSGSSQLGMMHKKRPWKKWKKCFGEEIDALVEYLSDHYGLDENELVLYGVSFGASLALLAGSLRSQLQRIIAVSPMVSLERHVKRLASPQYKRWFQERFGDFHAEFSPDRYLINQNIPVTVIQGDQDEVVDYSESSALVEQAKIRGLHWEFILEPSVGHVPQTLDEYQNRLNHIVNAVLGGS
ncbi:Prolyl oligopeptidase family protein [Seinonella peptonophila]|uniref:Prolyl oligopeptidase family protein n=1 Tax=Seinonella peptonophila TaxID=112248 RepID=A0A1M4Z9V8_9BACL|nr:prolyl oligopeptidase family serine peptidase [Seinonella peptonophila]SHF14849.1 Prolyl oligopeptidase family protein [Seinonella peptonophila]